MANEKKTPIGISDGGLFVLAGLLLIPWVVVVVAYAMVPAAHRNPFGWWCKLEVKYALYYPILILAGIAIYMLLNCFSKPRAASYSLFFFLIVTVVVYIVLKIACGLFGA